MAPRTEKQFEEIREKSRDNILAAALELFAIHGYHHTSISAVAKKAGISKGLIYNYFSSKEELLDIIVSEGLNEIGNLIDLMDEENEPFKKLELLIRVNFENLKSQKQYWKLYFSTIIQLEVFEFVKEKFMVATNSFVDKIEKIFADMGIKHPRIEAYKFVGMVDGICLHYSVFFQDEYPIEHIMKTLLQDYKKIAK